MDSSFLEKWYDLLHVLHNYKPGGGANRPIWTLEAFGVYAVKSFYKLINLGGGSLPPCGINFRKSLSHKGTWSLCGWLFIIKF